MVDFYRIIDLVNKSSPVPGIIVNLLLIYLITNNSRPQIGRFRYLLIIFSGYDIFLGLTHLLFDAKGFQLPGVFVSVLGVQHGSHALTVIYFTLYMVPYTVLITHLLYRYWAVQAPHKLDLFFDPKYILAYLGVACGMHGSVIFSTLSVIEPEESSIVESIKTTFGHHFGTNITRGWAVADYWKNGEYNTPAILGAFFYDLVGVLIIISAVSLAALTHIHINRSHAFSSTARDAQRQLLLTVCVQTFIPMSCVMIPYFCNLTLPIFGIVMPTTLKMGGLMMSLFPLLDGVAVILLMKPYREGLQILCRLKKEDNVQSVLSVSSAGVNTGRVSDPRNERLGRSQK